LSCFRHLLNNANVFERERALGIQHEGALDLRPRTRGKFQKGRYKGRYIYAARSYEKRGGG